MKNSILWECETLGNFLDILDFVNIRRVKYDSKTTFANMWHMRI